MFRMPHVLSSMESPQVIQSLTLIIACGCSDVFFFFFFFFIPESSILLQSVVMIESVKQLNKEDCSTFFMSYLELFFKMLAWLAFGFSSFCYTFLITSYVCLSSVTTLIRVTTWLDSVAVLRRHVSLFSYEISLIFYCLVTPCFCLSSVMTLIRG